ncbi:hypothetical protein [Actinokineospora xionganensis]|uniref:ANTAR domain-containing protein n=1 Tax=Actinokineospora xionganensis TaxID=2684470 RepID=A0ABR7L062_9PSEU|nr:hypothetical protein [Actinokineospora xionganensis]MBC6445913.1 hypothetical protein [Actinokineospora xionganensis]
MSGTEQESRKRHLAARVLASQAENAEELAVLLDMLGLSAAEGLAEPRPEDVAIPAQPRRSIAEREAARTLSSTLLGAATGH